MASRLVSSLLLASALLLPVAAPAAATPAPPIDTPFGKPQPDLGWSEAVISVSRLAVMEEFLTQVAQWRVVSRSETAVSYTHLTLPTKRIV